jgi:solute:Na+ symporter, SSS family
MESLDIAIIFAYLAAVFMLGWLAGRKRSTDVAGDFFLAGRSLPWWLVGTSMVATTLAADTPLAVAGMTITGGVAKNWFWWSFIISHSLMAMILARLWRRAGVVTDAEFVSIRYSGPWVGKLRSIKAFISAVLVNCVVMGWVFLAMLKVSAAVLPELSEWQVIGGLLLLTLIYSVRSGFHGVVWTDLAQFPIALAGTVILAVYAVNEAGGLDAVSAAAVVSGGEEALSLFPTSGKLLPIEALFTFLAVQWWAQKGSDGGGILIQRLSAARTERDAELGGLWFCVAHYLLRPWPWIITGLAAMVILPESAAADPEGVYAELIMTVLPVGLRGLLVAAFLAAFMSTIDTHLNWGASYMVNDLLRDRVTPERALLFSRVSVVLMAGLALGATAIMGSIEGGWKIVIVMGAGSGLVILMRWFWWRITAEVELVAVTTSIVLTCFIYIYDPSMPYLIQMSIVVGGSTVAWVNVMLRQPADPTSLALFYKKVRPPGPGWKAVSMAAGEASPPKLLPPILRWIGVTLGLIASLAGTGWCLISTPSLGLMTLAIGIILITLSIRSSLHADGSVTLGGSIKDES